uniref:Uncharacterized protein MANES_16G035500 n=1 Tax=Rhizophora mucronata TaxID=61149 RepID=A0A2P2J8Q2_RHIMU
MAMASTLGASSSYSSKAVLAMASIPFSSPSSKPLFPSLSFTPGKSNGRKYYGGIGIQCRKGRSQFHVKVTNVATDINSVEKVCSITFSFLLDSLCCSSIFVPFW